MVEFSTPEQLIFLFYKFRGDELPFSTFEGNEGRQLTLVAQPMELGTPLEFDELFEDVDVSRFVNDPAIASNYMANRIAQETRRGAGNIVIVGTREIAELIGDRAGRGSMPIVHDGLKFNEVRVAYWKIMGRTADTKGAVDGGVQYSPDGFSKLPNYKSYFKRGFV